MRRFLVGCVVALMVLVLWPTDGPGQSVKVKAQTRADSAIGASGAASVPPTSGRSRVRWTACVQLEATTAAWKCSTQTGPWVATPAPIDTTVQAHRTRGLELKPDSLGVVAGQTRQVCAFLRFRDGKVPSDGTAPAECLANYAGWFTLVERSISPAQRARADSIYGGLATFAGWQPWQVERRVAFARLVGAP